MAVFRRAFTLMEVNLAIFIMAVGVLGMVSLYSLSYRESRQSQEDVASAGFADAFLSPLAAGLSATNMTWQNWRSAVPDVDSDVCNGIAPQGGDGMGWAAYVRKLDVDNDGNYETFAINGNPNGIADGVYSRIIGKVPSEFQTAMPSVNGSYVYALVATRKGAVISLAFRASRKKASLMSQPVYYTEAHFQGRTDQ